MKVAFDCDDAGLPLKQVILEHLDELGVDAVDLHLLAQGKTDYPDIGYNLARRVAAKEFERGILVCGTGLGMAMVANKVAGVFAGTCHDTYSAERLCKSNAAQVLTLGARVVGPELAKAIVSAWIHSRFEGGRSLPKVERMRELERQAFARNAAAVRQRRLRESERMLEPARHPLVTFTPRDWEQTWANARWGCVNAQRAGYAEATRC